MGTAVWHRLRSRLLLVAAAIGVLGALLSSESVAVSLGVGDIVVLDAAGIWRIDPATGAWSSIASGSFDDFTLDPSRSVFATANGAIVRIDPNDGSSIPVASGGYRQITAGGVDQLLGSRQDPGTSEWEFVSIDATDGSTSVVSSGGSLSGGFDAEASGGFAFLTIPRAFGDGDDILRISLSDGSQTTFQGPLTSAALGADPSDDFIAVGPWTNNSTGLVRFEVHTGDQTVIGSTVVCRSDGQCEEFAQSDLTLETTSVLLFATGDDGGGGIRPELPPITRGLYRTPTDCGYGCEGVLVAEGVFSEVQVAVPEPNTILLLGGGLSGLGATRRGRASRRPASGC